MGNQNKFAFTMKRIEDLDPPEKERVYLYDTKAAGLAVCVTRAGSKTFYFYKWADGRPQRVRIGKFPDLSVDDARKAVSELTATVAKGGDPSAERRAKRETPSLQDLFDFWLDDYAKLHKKTWQEDVRKFNKYFGRLKSRRLSAITKADVQAWHKRLGKDHGPYLANRARALLSAMWGVAEDIGHEAPNPCVGVKKFKEQSRERFLQPSEMRAFFESLKEEEPLWRDFFLTCLFTGARKANVAAMRWADIDLENAVWYVAGEESKNGEALAIVLPAPALEVLENRIEDRGDSPWVFPNKSRAGVGRIVDPRKAWLRVLKRAEIENLRMHDLRRSLGSWQAASGASLAVIGKSLGHRDPKATAVYARLQLDPVRESVGKATTAMLEAANGKDQDNG